MRTSSGNTRGKGTERWGAGSPHPAGTESTTKPIFPSRIPPPPHRMARAHRGHARKCRAHTRPIARRQARTHMCAAGISTHCGESEVVEVWCGHSVSDCDAAILGPVTGWGEGEVSADSPHSTY